MMPIRTAPLRAFFLTLALWSAVLCAHAQTRMKIYRCVDASGAVTLQNDVACPKGSQQSVRNIGVLPTMPALVAVPPAPAVKPEPAASAPPSTAPPPAPAAPLVRTAPPPLFHCRSWDDRDYLGDTAEPPAACVPVQAMGIDGTTASAAGTSCEMRRDVCTAILADKLCTVWKKRVDEAEFRWKFGGGRDEDRKVEFDRLSKTYRDSTCLR